MQNSLNHYRIPIRAAKIQTKGMSQLVTFGNHSACGCYYWSQDPGVSPSVGLLIPPRCLQHSVLTVICQIRNQASSFPFPTSNFQTASGIQRGNVLSRTVNISYMYKPKHQSLWALYILGTNLIKQFEFLKQWSYTIDTHQSKCVFQIQRHDLIQPLWVLFLFFCFQHLPT